MNCAELISELRRRPPESEAWIRVNIAGEGMFDIAEKVYLDDAGDLIIEGQTPAS